MNVPPELLRQLAGCAEALAHADTTHEQRQQAAAAARQARALLRHPLREALAAVGRAAPETCSEAELHTRAARTLRDLHGQLPARTPRALPGIAQGDPWALNGCVDLYDMQSGTYAPRVIEHRDFAPSGELRSVLLRGHSLRYYVAPGGQYAATRHGSRIVLPIGGTADEALAAYRARLHPERADPWADQQPARL